MFRAPGSRRIVTAIVTAGVVAVGPAALGAPAGWGPPEVVSAHDFEDSWDPPETQVGVTRAGTAYAAWLQPVSGSQSRVYAARRSAAGVWSAPAAVSGRVSSYRPFDLAVGPAGLASVVWSRRVGGTWRVQESHAVDDAWSAATTIGRGTDPEVAVDGDRVTTLAYHRAGLKVVRRGAAGTWSSPRSLTGQQTSDVAVAADRPGNVVVTWDEPAASRLRAAIKPAGRAWRRAHAVATLPGEARVGSLEASFGPAARALVVWTTTDDWREAPHVYRNGVGWVRTTGAGAWSAASYLTRRIGEDGGQLSLSMNGSGEALAVWTAAGGGSNGWVRLQAARFRATGSWAPIVTLGTAWFETRAWMDDSGTARVLGHRAEPIWQRTQRPGEGWSAREVVVAHGDLAAASGAAYRLVMVWLQGSPLGRLTGAELDTAP